MNQTKQLISIFVFLCLIQFITSKNIKQVNQKTFVEEINKTKFTFVKFYATWCEHSKNLAPEYEKVSFELQTYIENKNLSLLEVDLESNENMKLKESLKIDSYPSLKLYKNGIFIRDYIGERTTNEIVNFLTMMLTSKFSILTTENELNQFLKTNKGNALIGEFKNEKFENIKKLKKLIHSDIIFDEFPIGIFVNSNSKNDENIKLYSSQKTEISIFDLSKNELSFENLKLFIYRNGFPFIDEINFGTFPRIAEAKLPLFIGFLNLTNLEQKTTWMEKLNELGKKYENKLKVVFADGILSKDQINVFGLDSENLPKFAGMKISEGINFPYDENQFDLLTIEKWIDSFLYEEVFHSQPEPEMNTNNKPVFDIVGITFDKYTVDSGKDVFIKFYISKDNCTECERVEPIFNQLGEEFKKFKNIIIGKIDCSLNDIPPEFRSDNFPRFMFFSKNHKEGLKYNGSFDQISMSKFIRENSVASKKDLKDEL
eukprot:gene3535-6270_t